eukprot:7860956-Pyramimonas_sp.AAC.1
MEIFRRPKSRELRKPCGHHCSFAFPSSTCIVVSVMALVRRDFLSRTPSPRGPRASPKVLSASSPRQRSMKINDDNVKRSAHPNATGKRVTVDD